MHTRPARLEINLDHMRHNIRVIQREISEGTKILSIVKSDGYKFGAVEIVEAVMKEGVSHFGVATLSEALSLRKHFPDIFILVLGYTPDYLMEKTVENNITPTIYSKESGLLLAEAARKLGKKAKFHFAVDTGMHRIGFPFTDKAIDEMVELIEHEDLDFDGMFTHFAVADTDPDYTKGQFEVYQKFVRALEERGKTIPHKHVSNSHATMRYREFDLDFVRPGILQYGSTEDDPYGKNFDVKFVGRIVAEIGLVKTVPAGKGISYGLTYTTDKERRIATLPLGYADGIPRLLSNKIDVLVNGKRCPQVGRICMDQFMIDVTDVRCKVGDPVVIIGAQGEEEITIEEISEKAGEIPTSFVTHFNKRLPREYWEDGKLTKVVDIVENL